MKVYIATFTQYENYGSRLQNFALCYILRKIGAEPISLLVTSKKEYIKNYIKSLLLKLPLITDNQLKWYNEKKKQKVFDNFKKELNLLKISYRELCLLNFNDAKAIVGSDQVWSPAHLKNNLQDINLFFLRFISKDKRIAYAPSLGINDIPKDMIKIYKKYITDFKNLSVREFSGQKLIKNLTNLDVVIMPDPVFLLTREEWINITNTDDMYMMKENYILVYFLSEQSQKTWIDILKYAENNGLKMIVITGNKYNKNSLIVPPDMFIKLLNNADKVFTDSFHGVAFSIIFKVPFIVFYRSDVKQFSRIETLLNKYSLNAVYKNNCDFDSIFDNEKFDISELVVSKERIQGIKYLKKSILNGV